MGVCVMFFDSLPDSNTKHKWTHLSDWTHCQSGGMFPIEHECKVCYSICTSRCQVDCGDSTFMSLVRCWSCVLIGLKNHCMASPNSVLLCPSLKVFFREWCSLAVVVFFIGLTGVDLLSDISDGGTSSIADSDVPVGKLLLLMNWAFQTLQSPENT